MHNILSIFLKVNEICGSGIQILLLIFFSDFRKLYSFLSIQDYSKKILNFIFIHSINLTVNTNFNKLHLILTDNSFSWLKYMCIFSLVIECYLPYILFLYSKNTFFLMYRLLIIVGRRGELFFLLRYYLFIILFH